MNQTPEMDEKKTSSPETAPIAATAEHNANFEENIRAIIRSGKPASVIRDDLDNYHANDIAEVLETLDTATPLQYSLSGNDGRDFHLSR